MKRVYITPITEVIQTLAIATSILDTSIKTGNDNRMNPEETNTDFEVGVKGETLWEQSW